MIGILDQIQIKAIDLEKKPNLYDFTKKVFTRRDTLKINLSAGGGAAIQLKYIGKGMSY